MEHSSRTWSLSAESRKRTHAKACTGHGSWVTRQKGPLSTAEACGGVAGAAILAFRDARKRGVQSHEQETGASERAQLNLRG